MTTANQDRARSSGNFPLDNLTYDLITILHEKAKGLEAYDKYQRDAQSNQEVANLIQQIRQQDEQHIQKLRQQLAQLLSSQHSPSSRAVGDSTGDRGSSMGGSPSVSMSAPGEKITEQVNTDDKTNQL